MLRMKHFASALLFVMGVSFVTAKTVTCDPIPDKSGCCCMDEVIQPVPPSTAGCNSTCLVERVCTPIDRTGGYSEAYCVTMLGASCARINAIFALPFFHCTLTNCDGVPVTQKCVWMPAGTTSPVTLATCTNGGNCGGGGGATCP